MPRLYYQRQRGYIQIGNELSSGTREELTGVVVACMAVLCELPREEFALVLQPSNYERFAKALGFALCEPSRPGNSAGSKQNSNDKAAAGDELKRRQTIHPT